MAEEQAFEARSVVKGIYAAPEELIALVHQIATLAGGKSAVTASMVAQVFSLLAADALEDKGGYNGWIE
jgi:hypothetical protein